MLKVKTGVKLRATGSLLLLGTFYSMVVGQTCDTPEDFLVSKNATDEAGDADSSEGMGSNTGNLIAFSSLAENLDPPGGGNHLDIFLHDLSTGTTSYVPALGESRDIRNPSLSSTGRYLVFSEERALGTRDIRFIDRETGVKEVVVSLLDVLSGDPYPESPDITDDGRFIIFASDTDLVPSDTNTKTDVYFHDRLGTGLTALSDHGADAHSPTVSDDGPVGGFGILYAYQVTGNSDLGPELDYVVVRPQPQSVASQTDFFPGTNPSISNRGRWVAYQARDPGDAYDSVYRHAYKGVREKVSIDSAGNPNTAHCGNPRISRFGNFVAFDCVNAMTTIPGTNQTYVRDTQNGRTYLASVNSLGEVANQSAKATWIGESGSALIVSSSATNLGNSPGGAQQVYRIPSQHWLLGCVQTPNSDTACDGIDDDCDDWIDEDFVPYVTNCGTGACATQGIASCNTGTLSDSCVPGPPTGGDTTCNGADEDCDASVDEHFTYQGQPSSCISFLLPTEGVTVCGDYLWSRGVFAQPVDPATFGLTATITEAIGTGSQVQTDVTQEFTIAQDHATARIPLTQFGAGTLSVNDFEVSFQRLAAGNPACPICEDIVVTEDELAAPLQYVMDQFQDPWANLVPIYDLMNLELGCAPESGAALQSVGGSARIAKGAGCPPNCDSEYCTDVDYCGRGTSETGATAFPLPDNSCLNRTCFEHDKCYRNTCTPDACAFTPQTDACDDAMVVAGCNNPACSVLRREKFICGVVNLARKRSATPECRQPACATGTVCCQRDPHNEPACNLGCMQPNGTVRCRECYNPGSCGPTLGTLGCLNPSGQCAAGWSNVGENPGDLCWCE